MAYEMKGHTLPGIKQKKSDKMKDGRPGSSAFQFFTPAGSGVGPVDNRSQREKVTSAKERGAVATSFSPIMKNNSPMKGGWWAKQTKGHGGPS